MVDMRIRIGSAWGMARSEFNLQRGRCSVQAFSLLLLPSPSSSHHCHHHHHLQPYDHHGHITFIPASLWSLYRCHHSQHHRLHKPTSWECCVRELMWPATFGECLFSPLSIVPLRFIQISVYINSFFILTASCISSHGYMGFPDTSVDKESACNAGDPGSFPRSGRSAGEGIGYPLQYSWASLVAQLVKNPPAMRETWAWSLAWEDPLERERLPTPVFWPGEFHGLYSYESVV